MVAQSMNTITNAAPQGGADVKLFLCLKDNFGVLVHDQATGATAAIDAPEAAPVEAALKAIMATTPQALRN
jgi:hypothetical protein